MSYFFLAALSAVISLLSAFVIQINSLVWSGMLITGVVGIGVCALAFFVLGLKDEIYQRKPDMTKKLNPGETWMRNRETGEAVLVTEVDAFMTRYQNIDCDGEVQTSKLAQHFEVLDEMPADAEPA